MFLRLYERIVSRKNRHSKNLLDVRLRQIIRRGQVMTSAAQMAGYDTDGLGYKCFPPDAVVIPADCEELSALMSDCESFDTPIIVRGAGTSLSGGPVAAQGGIIVHTSALRSINHICPEGLWCEVESGVTLRQLDNALVEHGLFYPPDPSSGMVCTLGGNVAMNAGGAHCFRYGVTGNYVLGVEVAMLNGSIHRFGGPAGGRGPWREDWKRFMIGSEGTLGTFTRFWLRLLPRPEKTWTFLATFGDLASAEKAIHALVGHPSFPVAIELMDPRCVALVENSPMAVGLPSNAYLLITEIDGPRDLVDSRVESVAALLKTANALQVDYSDLPTDRDRLWRARKAAGGLMGQMSADLVVQDAVIPKSALHETLQLIYQQADDAGIPVINVFHAGDGNLHPNFLFDSRTPGELEKIELLNKTLMKWVINVGGTLSGEHGIGNDKMSYMPMVFGGEGTKLQLAVAAAFNPNHQLNPSKVFAERRFGAIDSSADSTLVPVTTTGITMKNEASVTSEIDAPERLFSHFLDPLDAVACVPATSKLETLAKSFANVGLRLPLIFDPKKTIVDHVLASNFSPASSRFGGWCGMNWRLTSGKIVRIGERVVKSTTGYDLLKFLLSSGNRFGQAIDYVVRLRPTAANYRTHCISGNAKPLQDIAAEIIRSDWTHWFDSIDWIIKHQHTEPSMPRSVLKLVVHLPDNELSIATQYLEMLSSRHNVLLTYETRPTCPVDRLPDLVFKVAPNHAISLACQISENFSVRCVASCCVGAVFVHFDDVHSTNQPVSRTQANSLASDLVGQFATKAIGNGGDWRSKWFDPQPLCDSEHNWVSRFCSAAGIE
jgi:glycolate oxidase subunit GlcD